MKLILIIACVLITYIPVIAVISFIRALFSIIKGKSYFNEKLRDNFFDLFLELFKTFKMRLLK